MSNRKIEVVTPEIRNVLKAYATCPDPGKRGVIYRDDIDPILAKGERIPFELLDREPFQASNSLGTLAGNLVAQRTLATLVSMRPMLKDVLADFSDEVGHLGQQILTRVATMPTVENFGQPPSNAVTVDYPVTLSAHKQSYFSFTSAEFLATNRNLVEEHSEGLAVAMGNHLVDAVAALITDAFTSETIGAANTKDFSAVTTACAALNSLGVPDNGRSGWVNSAFAEALSNDEVMTEHIDSESESAYSRWKNVKGFRSITEFPALPGNGINLIGFFFHRHSLILATRVQLDPSQGLGVPYPGKIEIVKEPTTGLSVVNNLWIDPKDLSINARIMLVYGCARGLVGAGHKFVTS